MTVVVVTWRAAGSVDACLDSVLQGAAGVPHQVLVVDNDADAATRARLEARTDGVRVLRLARNTGFAGGVAAATAEVSTPWLFLLNDDAELAPGAMHRALARARETGAAAVQTTVRLAGDGPPLVNSTGNMVSRDGFGYDRDWLSAWPVPRDAADEPFGFSGSGALLRTAAVREVGGMDASLFLYYEDTDLSWRLRLGGHRVAFCPEAVVVHRHGQSSVEGSPLFVRHNERNRLLVLARDATVGLALRQWLRFPLTTASLALRGGAGRSLTVLRLRAYVGALVRLPATVRKRRGDRAVVPRRVVQRLLQDPPEPLRELRPQG